MESLLPLGSRNLLNMLRVYLNIKQSSWSWIRKYGSISMGRFNRYWFRCWWSWSLGKFFLTSMTIHFTSFYPFIQVIYATLQNSLDVVISLLDPATLDVRKTYRTNWRKQWSGNAFMACGVLYVLKKYDEKYTSLNYMYNTHTGTLFIYKAISHFDLSSPLYLQLYKIRINFYFQKHSSSWIFHLRINTNGIQWLTIVPWTEWFMLGTVVIK